MCTQVTRKCESNEILSQADLPVACGCVTVGSGSGGEGAGAGTSVCVCVCTCVGENDQC